MSAASHNSPLRIALWGNFGTLNFGNECTLAAATLALRRRLPGAQLVCICCDPDDVERRHGLPAVPLRARRASASERLPRPLRVLARLMREAAAWWRAVGVLRAVDDLVVVGTGVLTDAGEGSFGLPFELLKWSLAARWCHCRVIFLSVGVETIASPVARGFIGGALRRADYRSYRDAHSLRLIESLGLVTGPAHVYPDLAFGLVPPPDRDAPSFDDAQRAIVAVGLYAWRDRGAGGGTALRAYEAYLEVIAGFIQWLIARGRAVRVVIGDYAYDEGVRLDLRAVLEARGVVLDPAYFEDRPARSWEELIGQLRPVGLVVASRFHNVLLSLLLGKPVVSLSYEPKNDALMRQMGLAGYCRSLDGFDLATLTRLFRELETEADSLRPAIRRIATENAVALERQYDLVLGTMIGRLAHNSPVQPGPLGDANTGGPQ